MKLVMLNVPGRAHRAKMADAQKNQSKRSNRHEMSEASSSWESGTLSREAGQ